MSDQKAEAGAAPAAASEEDLWAEASAAETAASEPALKQEPDPQPEPKPAAEAAGDEQEEDPWSAVPEVVRSWRDEMEEHKRKLEHRLSSDSGRISALQRQNEDLRKALEERAKDREAAGDQPPKEGPLARLERLEEDYPELAEAIAPAILHLDRQFQEARQADATRHAAMQAQYLEDAHPDWAAVTSQNADTFLSWVNAQPEDRRRQIEENAQTIKDGRVAASIISDFKAHLQEQAPKPEPAKPAAPQPQQNPKRARQLQGAVSTRPSGQQAFSPGVPEDADPDAIWKAIEAEERAARRTAY